MFFFRFFGFGDSEKKPVINLATIKWEGGHGTTQSMFPIYLSGQISIIPKPELRGFWGSSLIKPPFRVTSADVVIICPDLSAGQMESYFTNLDFPDFLGGFSLPTKTPIFFGGVFCSGSCPANLNNAFVLRCLVPRS